MSRILLLLLIFATPSLSEILVGAAIQPSLCSEDVCQLGLSSLASTFRDAISVSKIRYPLTKDFSGENALDALCLASAGQTKEQAGP